MDTKHNPEYIAGNGLIHRRHLLGLGLAGIGSIAAGSALGADAGMLSIANGCGANVEVQLAVPVDRHAVEDGLGEPEDAVVRNRVAPVCNRELCVRHLDGWRDVPVVIDRDFASERDHLGAVEDKAAVIAVALLIRNDANNVAPLWC